MKGNKNMKKALKEMIEKNESLKVFGDYVRVNGGDLFPLPLVDGNDKIGKGVWHASTLPGSKDITFTFNDIEYTEKGTCPITCPGCYGLSGFYNYDSTKYYLMQRTRFLKEYPALYFYVCRCQIMAENIKYIRIHATGDFIPGEAAGWYEIFKAMPHLKGWTYTKCDISGDIAMLDSLDNFNIVKSIVPGCGFNFGHIDYILSVYDHLKSIGETPYICRCGIDKNQHCNNCTGCSKNKYVLFIEHSTDYKAEKDILYSDIKALIESQPEQLLQA